MGVRIHITLCSIGQMGNSCFSLTQYRKVKRQEQHERAMEAASTVVEAYESRYQNLLSRLGATEQKIKMLRVEPSDGSGAGKIERLTRARDLIKVRQKLTKMIGVCAKQKGVAQMYVDDIEGADFTQNVIELHGKTAHEVKKLKLSGDAIGHRMDAAILSLEDVSEFHMEAEAVLPSADMSETVEEAEVSDSRFHLTTRPDAA